MEQIVCKQVNSRKFLKLVDTEKFICRSQGLSVSDLQIEKQVDLGNSYSNKLHIIT